MKQKFDLKITIKGDNDRKKALTVAAKMTGVVSVMIGGRDKNILTVIGDEVDIVALSRSLAKKLGHGSATVVRVVPLNNNGGYDQERQAEASMRYYGGESDYYRGDYNYSRPKYSYYYNNPPAPQYSSFPTPYYLCEKPDDEYSSCSIM